MSEDRVVLPKSVVPQHYDLSFEPNLDACTFVGTASITVVVNEATDTVVLHARDLEIGAVHAHVEGFEAFESTGIEYDAEAERASIRFANALPKGKASLQLSFKVGCFLFDLV
eukprot:TRINITY_DN3086_c0_g1_i3.p1 TRINITY_DN3086_c0_g1~~TRINITY_DN3086_c0_g1_i3.p1  ORF type:complete len:113 (-),score=27.55 TRINITY_DN3086_c0_g1_i3:370-708(-)